MLKIEEYLQTLPETLINGEDVQISDKSLRDIFKFVGLGQDDIFYHLGCGDARGVQIATAEFGVKKAVGIDNNDKKIAKAMDVARSVPCQQDTRYQLVCQDITQADISDATVVLFWFMDDLIVDEMMRVFEYLTSGTRIITVWGPLPGCLPDKVDFPYILNKVPLKLTLDLREQMLAVLNVKCIDFVTAWEFAERYTKAIGSPEIKNDRFLTIIQTLTIWINAKKLGVACGDKIPDPIRTYVKIMKMHFDIDFEYLLPELQSSAERAL